MCLKILLQNELHETVVLVRITGKRSEVITLEAGTDDTDPSPMVGGINLHQISITGTMTSSDILNLFPRYEYSTPAIIALVCEGAKKLLTAPFKEENKEFYHDFMSSLMGTLNSVKEVGFLREVSIVCYSYPFA